MLTIKKLKELIADLPDDVGVVAYEGEGCGLRVIKGDAFGWIDTGWDDENECNHSEHDLKDFS